MIDLHAVGDQRVTTALTVTVGAASREYIVYIKYTWNITWNTASVLFLKPTQFTLLANTPPLNTWIIGQKSTVSCTSTEIWKTVHRLLLREDMKSSSCFYLRVNFVRYHSYHNVFVAPTYYHAEQIVLFNNVADIVGWENWFSIDAYDHIVFFQAPTEIQKERRMSPQPYESDLLSRTAPSIILLKNRMTQRSLQILWCYLYAPANSAMLPVCSCKFCDATCMLLQILRCYLYARCKNLRNVLLYKSYTWAVPL